MKNSPPKLPSADNNYILSSTRLVWKSNIMDLIPTSLDFLSFNMYFLQFLKAL